MTSEVIKKIEAIIFWEIMVGYAYNLCYLLEISTHALLELTCETNIMMKVNFRTKSTIHELVFKTV